MITSHLRSIPALDNKNTQGSISRHNNGSGHVAKQNGLLV